MSISDISSLHVLNHRAYSRREIVEYYSSFEELLPAEARIIESLMPEILNCRILDVGIGGGRTTPHLLRISQDYVGIDYVLEFAETAAGRFPEADIRWGDATNLTEFADGSRDLVVFSYNGIDCVTHEERLRILSEVNRVLAPGGIFIFSSHNRDYENFNRLPWRRKIEWNSSFLHFYLYCLYHLPTHFSMKKREIFTDEYALVNDPDHGYSLLFYYIDIPNQTRQLEAQGFKSVTAYDMNGNVVTSDRSSHWIYYVARKA